MNALKKFLLILSFFAWATACQQTTSTSQSSLSKGEVALSKSGAAILTWDASSGPGFAGYKLYFYTLSGTSRMFAPPVDVGNHTTYTVNGLSAGAYHFYVTAYDTAGAESLASNEVVKAIQ